VSTATPLTLEVASDVICPWCYIGKRRLEKALEGLAGEVDVTVRWLPFQLNPDMPEGGIARSEYRTAKFGSLEKARALDARVAGEARGEGLEFAFDRMQRTPNTFAAHQLIALAQSEGKGEAMVEALFNAYFIDARDIGDRTVLLDIALAQGLSEAEVQAAWADTAGAERLAGVEREMRDLGINGVPFFVIDRRFGVSGAQPPEALVDAIRKALT
jgi:predicted DsbA family dithiol-disulfide isomerase